MSLVLGTQILTIQGKGLKCGSEVLSHGWTDFMRTNLAYPFTHPVHGFFRSQQEIWGHQPSVSTSQPTVHWEYLEKHWHEPIFLSLFFSKQNNFYFLRIHAALSIVQRCHKNPGGLWMEVEAGSTVDYRKGNQTFIVWCPGHLEISPWCLELLQLGGIGSSI